MTTTNQFQFNAQDVRIVLDERGEPLFVGKDVCEVLGYANPNDALNDHCRGVAKRYPIVDSLNRIQEVRVLSEGDVMRLIVRSNLPAAVEFERLVFDEVLPSIRKTGKYRVGQKPEAPKRLPAVPDGDYPATITHCDIEKVRRVPEDPSTEEDRFILTVLIDAGEHAGLMVKTDLSMAWKTDEREQARALVSGLTKACGLVMASNTGEFIDAKVSVRLGHKWHKSQRYNYVAGFKARPADAPSPVNATPLLAYAPPRSEPKRLEDKATKLLPNKQAVHPALRVRKEKPAPIEYINDAQIREIRNLVKNICQKESGLYSFQVFNWIYNQMDIRDETRIPKARLKEAVELLNDIKAGSIQAGGAS